jgi:hypothetical protein
VHRATSVSPGTGVWGGDPACIPARPLVFTCPVRGEPLNRAERTLRCVSRHLFDVAHEGYVNLLLAQHRGSKDPGYSKEMIAGRRDFFDAGHYEPLADGIAELIAAYLPVSSVDRVVIDAESGRAVSAHTCRALRTRSGRQIRLAIQVDLSPFARSVRPTSTKMSSVVRAHMTRSQPASSASNRTRSARPSHPMSVTRTPGNLSSSRRTSGPSPRTQVANMGVVTYAQ